MNPNVFIIILNWNGKKDTLECLSSLKKIYYKNYKIVLVDNGSKDDSVKEIKKNFPSVEIIKNKKNLGFSEGNNVGIRYALKNEADYVLLLNNDTIVYKDFLKKMIGEAEKNEQIGIIGPKIYYYSKPKILWFSGGMINYKKGLFTHIGQNKKDSKEYSHLGNVDYITGCAMLIKKSVIKSIGLLDPKYFAYFEDIDYCIRAKKAGYGIRLVPEAKIKHKVSSSSGGEENPLKTYYKNRNILLFMKKHSPRKAIFSFFLHFFKDKAIEIAILTIKRKTACIKAILRGIYDGLTHKIDS